MARRRPAPQPAAERPLIGTAYWCLRGQRRHRAYLQPGRGGSVWWCQTHGVLMSVCHEWYPAETDSGMLRGIRRMTPAQQRRWLR